MKMKQNGNWFVVSFKSVKEYIDELDESGIENIKYNVHVDPRFSCVKNYDTLLEKMRYDKDLMRTYLKTEGHISFVKEKALVNERKYRDSGTYFEYARYLDGRTCVYKRKPVDMAGSGRGGIVSVVLNVAENCKETKARMMYKTLATIEMVKLLQAQGKNVELHIVAPFVNYFRGGENILFHILIKRGDAPLIVPEVVSTCAPYFMRNYIVMAQGYNFHLKTRTEFEGTIVRCNHGSAVRFGKYMDDNTKENIFSFCRIEKTSIIIDSQTCVSEIELNAFRKEHGIQIRK